MSLGELVHGVTTPAPTDSLVKAVIIQYSEWRGFPPGGIIVNIRQLLGLPDLLNIQTILCVQPHPDDNEVGAGGTLMELANRGARLVYVTVTDGRAGSFGLNTDPNEIVRVRREEEKQAGHLVGVAEHINLDYPDGGDYSEESVAVKLVDVFRRVRPDVVLTVDPWMPYEAHPDHIKTGRAVVKALLFSNNLILYPAATRAGADPFEVPQVAFYATSYPNTFVDVTRHWEKKLQAILAHKSQFDNAEWVFLSAFFEHTARETYQAWKRADDQVTGLAEAFKVLSPRQLHFVPSTIYN